MEILDIYNSEREKTGRTFVRGTAIERGDYHLVVHGCIFNSNNEMLIQQRHSQKSAWPAKWDVSVAGNAMSGDSSQKAIERELQEELGISIDFSDRRANFTINFENGFDDYYIINDNINLNDIVMQDTEVQAVKWATIEEIFDKIDSGIFIPHHKSIITLCFDSRFNYGSIDMRKFRRE